MNHPNTASAHNAFKSITNRLHHSGGGRLYSLLLLLLVGALSLLLAAPLQAAKPTAPAAPSYLAATPVSSTQINVSWRDTSGNESGFIIERGVSSLGPWTQIATTGVNATSYSNYGLNAATTYYYRVRAYNTRGSSIYSNVASATTAQNSVPTCTYSISPASASFPSGGGIGSSSVAASSTCNWMATSGATWITITAGASGTGSGTTTYSVAANTSTSSRMGTLTIAGQTFTVTQAGAACAYSISATTASPGSAATTGSVSVTAGASCGWTASSSATSWLTCTPASATGSGAVSWTVTENTSTTSRTATLTIGGQTFTVTQSGAACTYSISPTSASPGGAVGSGSVSVTAGAGCGWTASSSATSWLTCTPASGTGNGSVTWSVTANTSTGSRTGTLTIGGQTFTVTQAGAACTYSISPTSANPSSAVGSGSVSVTAGAGCGWTASSSATTWLSCTPASGTGNGSVTWSVTANTSSSSRTGTLTIGGQTFTVTQAGAACTYSISSTSANPSSAASTGSVSVTAGAGCSWTASSSATTWLTCTPASGTGNGSVSWSASANTSTSSRSGTLTIGGQTFTVNQAGAACTYSISATSANPGSTAGTGSVSVTAGAGCSWTASSSATSWLTCTPASGTGIGSVTWSVTANTSTGSRMGTLTIGGQTFTVTQAGAACSYTLSTTSASYGATSGTGSVNITPNGSSCTWTAGSSAAWITITSGAGGTGNGTVNYSVSANTGSARGGTLTIAGQPFTVSQAAATIDNPPTATLTAPSNGATISGTATFTASATDDVGVTRVEFWCDGSLLLGTATTAPYSVSYNTAGIPDGLRTFTCKAFDGAGHSTASASITATVGNSTTVVSGAYIWSRHFGGATFNVDNAFPSAIKEDRNGDVIVVGSFQKTVDFGGGSMTATASGNNAPDLFIAKYSGSTGAHLWSQRIGSSGSELANGVAVDAANNILVAGTFGGAVDFGGTILTSAGSTDIFVAKYGGNGALLWAKRFGGTAAETCNALALDAANNILLTGAYGLVGTAVDFGGGPLPLSGGQSAFQNDVYVAKLSATGGYLWSGGYGSVGNEQGYGIAVDGNGDVAVIGEFQGTSSFGGGSLVSAGGYDVFVAKYSGANGSHLWSQKGGSTADDRGRAITFDASGNVFVTGEFQLTANFGGNALVSANNLAGMILAKYSSAGAHLWSRGFSAMAPWGFVTGKGIVVDGAGNIVVSGAVTGSADFDGTLLGGGTVDILLAKFSPVDGRKLWVKAYGGQMDDYSFALTIGAADNILATGYYTYTVDFGGGVMDSPGGFDGFIVKLKP